MTIMDHTSKHTVLSAEDILSELNFGLGQDDDSSSSIMWSRRMRINQTTTTTSFTPQEVTIERRIGQCRSEGAPTLKDILSIRHTVASTHSCDPVARLSEDVSALILSHLSLQDIASVSQTCKVLYQACRTNQLWKYLFEYRWNVASDKDDDAVDFFEAYREAHLYPHDLWVTHWNCVYPSERLSPGRCCLRKMQRTSRKIFSTPSTCPTDPACDATSVSTTPTKTTHTTTAQQQCPFCRDWEAHDVAPPCPPNQVLTPAGKVAQRTRQMRQRLADQQIQLPDLCADNSSSSNLSPAENAFRVAATFQRQLNIVQYQTGKTKFLTDLLFFNLMDPFTSAGEWEREQLLAEASEGEPGILHPPTVSSHATNHHSWHMIELRNPDLFRPILFQFGVQRPECFTVYPSEGLIEPGATLHVTIGVTPLGSALAFAFEGLDVHRDGLSSEWASLYTNEAHLPFSPFLIRYRFATTPPAPVLDAHRRYVVPAETTDPKEATLEYHFQQDFAPHHFRTIYLSAHVNAHYNYWEFFRQTCQPWVLESRRANRGPIWVAPILAEKFPRTWWKLDKTLVGDLPFFKTRTYTEGPCHGCGLLWGERDEELVQRFFHDAAIAYWYQATRKILQRNIALCIDVLPRISDRNEDTVSILLYVVLSIIQTMKASKFVGTEEVLALLDQESTVDEMCQKVRVGGESWIPWRSSGVYRYIRCTDSVFGGEVVNHGKDEPEYLDAFRHLTHCPGSFCLGRQVDQNHLYSMVKPSSRRYIQKQGNPVSDIFLDDPISALQAGICMIQDPRSLLLHGLYDRIRYPGSIVRRPMLDIPHLFPDIAGSNTPHVSSASYGIMHYIHDVPPPGVGRFALSAINFHEPNPKPTIFEVTLDDDHHEIEQPVGHPMAHDIPPLRPRPAPARRGPRFVQMLWTLGASLGLVVIDSSNVSSVFVDRTILIATHWISISLMIAPLLVTLTARYAQWIPAQPVDYSLDGLPFALQNEMRFLTERECGLSAVVLLGVWMALGRWSERHTYRDLFRAMLEHLVPDKPETSFVRRCIAATKLWLLRRWDAFCPLFLQRRVFSPHWNLRTQTALIKHLAFWRARNLTVHRNCARAEAGQQDRFFGDSRDQGIEFGSDSSTRKIVVGILVVLASFCASSPHFWLNMTTVFASSVSLGISISIQSLEKGRPQISVTNTGSLLRELNLLTVFISAFLVGQLVGSSGGTMFLAEFIVTSISLVLGGAAGTVSASAFESWVTFFVLSWTAFWGYLFGRVGLIDGILLKRRGYSTVLLSSSVAVLGIFWTFVLVVGHFDSPVNLVLLRPLEEDSKAWSRQYASKMLQ